VRSVYIELSLFYSKTGFSARTADRSASAGGLTFPGAAHIGAPSGGSLINRVLKNRASRRDPALCGFCKFSHIAAYAALSKTPHALADGLMLVFQQPVEAEAATIWLPEEDHAEQHLEPHRIRTCIE
jgi:hypothetical protein